MSLLKSISISGSTQNSDKFRVSLLSIYDQIQPLNTVLTVVFQLVSPLKSISISGSTQNSDKFRVSLLNVYDQRQPLNTVLTVDPVKKTVSLVMNYDEGKLKLVIRSIRSFDHTMGLGFSKLPLKCMIKFLPN